MANEIYAEMDTIQGNNPNNEMKAMESDNSTFNFSTEVSQQRGRRLSRAAVVCLGLLCVLLLAGITGLGLHYQGFKGQCHAEVRDQQLRYSNLTARRDKLERERDRLENCYNNQTAEREQLQNGYNTLTAERNQLEMERDRLQNSYNNQTAVREQLQNSYNNQTAERDQLNEKIRVLESPCQPGWWRFRSSCYHISTKAKSWAESRQDCKSKGADLVVIDSREEQTFLAIFGKRVWIGLTDSKIEGTWTWVDGKRINPLLKFWDKGEPNDGHKEGEDCVEFDSSKMAWNDIYCADKLPAVCEK